MGSPVPVSDPSMPRSESGPRPPMNPAVIETQAQPVAQRLQPKIRTVTENPLPTRTFCVG